MIKLNANAMMDVSGTITEQLGLKSMNTNFIITQEKLSVMMQAHFNVQVLNIEVTGLQVSVKGFYVSVLQVLIPPLTPVLNNP